jgi:hypothetical protein
MCGRLRIWLILGVLSQYACTMTLGQALHSLTGCDHLAHDLHAEATAGQVPDGLMADAGDEHDPESCPICQCHYLAQQPVPPSITIWNEHFGRKFFAGALLDASVSPLRSYSSRAPPSFSVR